LWFDDNDEEATKLYRHEFKALNGGPRFKLNEEVSPIVKLQGTLRLRPTRPIALRHRTQRD